MSTAILLALVLGYAFTERAFGAEPSLDVARPLVRFSPTRGTNDSLYANDGFGYSAAIHHTVADLSGLTLEEVLEQVRIIAGSPRGRFPGGFDDMFPDELNDAIVCNESEAEYVGLTPLEQRKCFGVSGLVYLCRANTIGCEPFLGNGNKTLEDGYLYKRNPNVILTRDFSEYSHQALMGATMHSTGDYFVACAPRFSYRRTFFDAAGNFLIYEPRGRCVFSERNLKDFKFLDPCDVYLLMQFGSDSNQRRQGFCQAGSSVFITKSNKIIVGTPGNTFSSGGLGFYDNLTGEGMIREDVLDDNGLLTKITLPISGITAFSQPPDVYSDVSFTYFGSSVVAGNFSGDERYLTGSIRYQPLESSPGAINLLSSFGDPDADDNLQSTVTTMIGNQLGESYGKGLLAADLNGDGYDELIVTAPTYSNNNSQSPELGRVYILSSANQSPDPMFETMAVLTGKAKLGRFGHAVTSLGDLNNDGLEDLAISAPYEGSGVVYIYYGSATTYIESEPRQTITGQDMVDRVSELDYLTSFGAFLQGNADIDNNEYRDLLIGAEESQAIFVLRARPLATIVLDVTVNETFIAPSAANCVLESDGTPYPCFEVRVCANYTGRGLTSFDAIYTVTEIKAPMTEPRLIFEDAPPLSFTGAEVEACSSLTAYVVLDVAGVLDDLRVMVEMQQFELPTALVNTTLQFTDLSTEPVIVSEPMEASVGIAIDCSDNVCDSDLGLVLNNLAYLNSTGDPTDENELVVGAITSMRMDLTYYNRGEQALNFQMLITLPDGFRLFTPETESGIVTCLPTDDMDEENTLYLCTDFRVPLMQNESRTIRFSWGEFGTSLRGDEGILSVSAQIMVVNRTENIEPTMYLGDNSIQEDIPIVAEATYSVQVTYPPTTPTYMVTELQPEVDSSSQLGSPLPITVTFTNSGPSTLPGVSLVILLPLRNATDTGDYYYLYALNINDAETGISCAASNVREIVNPSDLVLDERRRKRRSLRENAPGIMNRVVRTIRQTPPQITLDCAENPELCSRLECNLTDIGAGQSRTLVIRTRIDNRFFFDKAADYVLTTFVRVVEDADSFVDTTNSPDILSASVTLSMQAIIPDASGIPDWVIAICVLAGFVFIVIVAIILALLIFLHLRRRKMRGEHEIKEDEVETYNEKAFDHDASNL